MSKPSTRGGARKGAGRKSPLAGTPLRASIVITPADRSTLEQLGDGVLSLGIQRAAAVVRERF